MFFQVIWMFRGLFVTIYKLLYQNEETTIKKQVDTEEEVLR